VKANLKKGSERKGRQITAGPGFCLGGWERVYINDVTFELRK